MTEEVTRDPVAAWASSGAMALSGRIDGPPIMAPGVPALLVQERLADFARTCTERTGRHPFASLAERPDVRLLGERAAIAGFTRNGPRSCGGAFRAVRTIDGWFGLSLPRADDIAMVPALVESGDVTDPWAVVSAWARQNTGAEALGRARLLGLAAAAWPPASPTRPGVVITEGGRRAVPDRPLVVDLTSLWAGPLCAHLLGLAECRVVKVESSRRLDGARSGAPAFFDLLHAGHESVTFDFTLPDDQQRLAHLLHRADLVLDASRPRALEALGIRAHEYVAAGTTWLSITAEGRASGAIGFGDDVALGAGLALEDNDDLLPVGDALADPLAGVAAAAAAATALLSDTSRMVDVSMLAVAQEAAGPMPSAEVTLRDGAWWVRSEHGVHQVADPHTRTPSGRAPQAGADRARWYA